MFLAVSACVCLSACSYVPRIVTEYRIDVQQGNVLTQDLVAQLKPGQTRDQVRFILGTPMLADVFHAQRWDYVYRFQNGRTNAVEMRRLSVFFDKNDRLERVTGDVDAGSVSELTGPVAKTQVIDLGSLSPEDAGKPLPPPEEKGFFGNVREKIGL
ncbi:MAG TPA: outer membrane protein assembly factor BamE [Rhodocyclaceae bacterium]|nr:outer membrane protein assembly factor BamE [Rhodocyclaceae bacterium]